MTVLFALFSFGFARAAENDGLNVTVESVKDQVVINAAMFVDASPKVVWAVLVDYDNATRFIADLRESRVVERRGNTLRVQQRSVVHFGPIPIPINSVREITLFEPDRIEGKQVSGTLAGAETHTEVVPTGAGTTVRYRARGQNSIFVPNAWVKRQTEAKFLELRAEMLRRAQSK